MYYKTIYFSSLRARNELAKILKAGYNCIIMKAQIHPQYFDDAQVVCSCGNKFIVGSTKQNIHVELCDNCHPFYTGQARFVDNASRIERFKMKQDAASKVVTAKKKKQDEKQQEEGQPQTLREMLQAIKRG